MSETVAEALATTSTGSQPALTEPFEIGGVEISNRVLLAPLAGHLLKTQLLEPHWEKKAAEVVALERATLYGLVVYNNRRVSFAQVDPHAARELRIAERLEGDACGRRAAFRGPARLHG